MSFGLGEFEGSEVLRWGLEAEKGGGVHRGVLEKEDGGDDREGDQEDLAEIFRERLGERDWFFGGGWIEWSE